MTAPRGDVPHGYCPVCRVSIRITREGLVFKHERWRRHQRRYTVCDGTGQRPRPLDRVTSLEGER